MGYLPENARGIGSATSPLHKTAETAPAGQGKYCTYFEVYGKYRTGKVEETTNTTYRIFLGGNNTNDYNLLRNHAYTINVTLRGKNEVDVRLENQLESANCFMVSQPSTDYSFDATVMGNGTVTPSFSWVNVYAPPIIPTPLDPDGAMLVWETGTAGSVIEPGSVKLSDDRKRISFKTSATIGAPGRIPVGGNAVIAATKGGVIIWSWHIWFTTYNPETDYDTYTTRTITHSNYNSLPSRTLKVMKVNLGAASPYCWSGDVYSIGLYYQWGRKDPIIHPANYAQENAATAFTNRAATSNAPGYEWGTMRLDGIAGCIQNPTKLTQTRITQDNLWGYANPTQNALSIQGSKSIYDPCPKGWQVAPSDTWTMFTTSTDPGTYKQNQFNVYGGKDNGWYFYCSAQGSGPTAYYPITGIRYNTGELSQPLYEGYYWSSTPIRLEANTRAYALQFGIYSVQVYPAFPAERGSAMPVRCVKE